MYAQLNPWTESVDRCARAHQQKAAFALPLAVTRRENRLLTTFRSDLILRHDDTIHYYHLSLIPIRKYIRPNATYAWGRKAQ